MDDAPRYGNVFGEGAMTPIVAAGDTDYLAAVAKIDLAPCAVPALPAKNGRVEGDAIAYEEVTHLGAETGYCSGGLVSHDDGRNAAP